MRSNARWLAAVALIAALAPGAEAFQAAAGAAQTWSNVMYLGGVAGVRGKSLDWDNKLTISKEKIVFLTIADDEDMFEEALEWDVKGYLLKDCTAAEIVKCVRTVAGGRSFTAPAMTTYLVDKTRRMERLVEKIPGLRLLTPQERLILKRVAQDKSSKEIAEEMGIAPKTVDAHRMNICNKLDIHGNHVLGRFAARHRNEI